MTLHALQEIIHQLQLVAFTMSKRFLNHYGLGHLVAPPPEAQKRILYEARSFVLDRFKPGVRSAKPDVAEILKCVFGFYSSKLDRILKKLASREFMEFTLYQYDVTSKKRETLVDETTNEGCQLNSHLASTRRAIKYLAELTALRPALPERATVGRENLFNYTEEAFFLSGMLASLYMLSDQAYYLFPGQIEIELCATDIIVDGDVWPVPFRLTSPQNIQPADVIFNRRLFRDREHRGNHFPADTLNYNPQKCTEFLNPSFENSFGCSFSNFMEALVLVNERTQPLADNYPVFFFSRGKLVCELGKMLSLHEETIEIILRGFTITQFQMREEERVIFKPNQNFRAFRRGYFEFPHASGTHLVWSKSLAAENFLHLHSGLCFKKLPEEWLTETTRCAMEALSNEAGAWFERETKAKFELLGINGSGRKNLILGKQGKHIPIPPEIGQLDFLGVSRQDNNALVLAECKMLEGRLEPRFFRDDISSFITARDCYSDRFRKKINWVVNNRQNVADAFGLKADITRILTVLITLYPSYAAYKILDFPCVSLVEFMEDYNAKGFWPYSIGMK